MNKSIQISLIVLALTLLALGVPARAWAHGAAEITVMPDTVAPGGKITVSGTKLGKTSDIKISLEGLTYRAPLGTAHTDYQEQFTMEFTIPVDAPEGDYLVKALTADGDAVSADLSITPPLPSTSTAASATANAQSGAAPEATMAPMTTPGSNGPTNQPTTIPQPMPSAAEHQLPRSRTPVEVVALFLVAALSAGLGLVLVRRK